MRRDDDFAERRKHIAELSDQELYDRFWELTDKVVDPLLELGRKNTTPSVVAFKKGEIIKKVREEDLFEELRYKKEKMRGR